MEIYILYFVFIFLLWVYSINQRRREVVVRCLKASLIVMFLVFVLRDFSVGRDIPGYKETYEMTSTVSFWDFDYVYFEKGYLLLCKLFNLMDLPFRAFFIFVYAIILIPLYYFFKNHSKDPLFSIIVYYCYQFFVLDMSGLRQSLAMSVCLMAYMVLRSVHKYRVLYFALIVAAAFSIHRSAVIFSAVGFLILKKETRFSNTVLTLVYIGTALFVSMYDQYILLMMQDQELTEYGFSDSLRAGTTLILNTFWLIFILFAFFTQHSTGKYRDLLVKYIHIMICACVAMFALSGSPLLRASSYYLIFLTIVLPEFISLMGKRSGAGAIKFMIVALYFYMFYSTVLAVSQLDIVPYKFAF